MQGFLLCGLVKILSRVVILPMSFRVEAHVNALRPSIIANSGSIRIDPWQVDWSPLWRPHNKNKKCGRGCSWISVNHSAMIGVSANPTRLSTSSSAR
jgi:hypothetical protein